MKEFKGTPGPWKWDGVGMPPVGCECEAKYLHSNAAEWFNFRCVGVDCGVAFGWSGNHATALGKDSYEFRPIRSEADKKRDEIAGALIRYLDSETDIDNVFKASDVIGFMDYVASGKIPGVKLED